MVQITFQLISTSLLMRRLGKVSIHVIGPCSDTLSGRCKRVPGGKMVALPQFWQTKRQQSGRLIRVCWQPRQSRVLVTHLWHRAPPKDQLLSALFFLSIEIMTFPPPCIPVPPILKFIFLIMCTGGAMWLRLIVSSPGVFPLFFWHFDTNPLTMPIHFHVKNAECLHARNLIRR